MKWIRPFLLIADTALTENRLPVRRTVGVWPFAPQVRPVTWSERMPTWSAKSTSAASAFARIAGQVCSRQTRTAVGVLLDGWPVGALEGQPPAAQVLAHPLPAQADPAQLR